jgi:hypothetical protein
MSNFMKLNVSFNRWCWLYFCWRYRNNPILMVKIDKSCWVVFYTLLFGFAIGPQYKRFVYNDLTLSYFWAGFWPNWGCSEGSYVYKYNW